MPFVYLLRCRDGKLYAGAAKDLDRRLAEHAAGRASRFTRGRLPVALVWSCAAPAWGAALREEARIKRLTRAAKEALIAGEAAGPGEAIQALRPGEAAPPRKPAGPAGPGKARTAKPSKAKR